MCVCVCVIKGDGETDKDGERTTRSWESAAVEVDYEVVGTLRPSACFERGPPNSFVL